MFTRALSVALLMTATVAAIQPPENLVADQIPAIPDALVKKAAPYLESRAASFWDWHPTRREILIGTRFAETMQAHQVKTPGGDRRQLTFLSEPVASARFRPITAEFLLFSQDTGGGEFFQIFRQDAGDARPVLITDGRSRNLAGPWSNSGQFMAFTSTARNGSDTDIYIVDPSNPNSMRMIMQVSGGGWSPLDWSPDDKQILLLHYVSINESYLHLLDLRSGAPQLLTPKPESKEKISYANAKFSKDGGSIFFTTDRQSEFKRLVRSALGPAELGTMNVMTGYIPWDIEEYDISPDGKTIAIVSNEEGWSVLRFIDSKTGREKLKPEIPKGVINGATWHKTLPEIAFSLSSARSPSDVYSVNMKGKVERWTESETGGLDAEQFVQPELAHLKSFDGLDFSAFVYMPDPAKFKGRRPALILIHGGPEAQSLPTFQARNNYLINELGIALVVPNVRGSAGYGKTFLTLDNATKREDSVRDIGALLKWIQKSERLDGDRVAVMGGSYGGYMTLASMVHYSDQLRCGIDIVGISDFITFLKNTQDYRRDLRRAEYGDERIPEVRAYLEKIAPARNVGKITKPMMIIQGANDPRVPLSESEQMVAALRAAKIDTWYLMAKDEGHGFRKKRNVDFQFYSTLLFLERRLLNYAE